MVVPPVNGILPPQQDNEVRLFEGAYFDFQSREILTPYGVAGVSYPANGKFVFWNQAGTKYFGVVQADAAAAMTNDFGVMSYSFP